VLAEIGRLAKPDCDGAGVRPARQACGRSGLIKIIYYGDRVASARRGPAGPVPGHGADRRRASLSDRLLQVADGPACGPLTCPEAAARALCAVPDGTVVRDFSGCYPGATLRAPGR